MKQINIVFQLPYKTQYLKLYHLYISFHPVVIYNLRAVPKILCFIIFERISSFYFIKTRVHIKLT